MCVCVCVCVCVKRPIVKVLHCAHGLKEVLFMIISKNRNIFLVV